MPTIMKTERQQFQPILGITKLTGTLRIINQLS